MAKKHNKESVFNRDEDDHKKVMAARQEQEQEGIQVEPSKFALSPNADMRRTFRQRTFSKLGKGSLRGSIFSLCASAIGSGVLSLPYVLKLCGYA